MDEVKESLSSSGRSVPLLEEAAGRGSGSTSGLVDLN